MKSSILLTAVLLLALAGLCQAQDPLAVTVLISPDTVVLEEDVDEYVLTVHAAIPYSSVDLGSVALTIGELLGTGADSRGELVAKFGVTKAELPAGETLWLTLSGTYTDGTFKGKDDISVIEKASQDGPGKDDGDDPRKNREGDRRGKD